MTSSSTTKPVIFLAFANDRQNYLYNLTTEQRSIRSELESAEKAGLCEVVYETDTTIENIFDVFQKYRGRVAIFHYGGHADDYKMLLESKAGGSSVAHSVGLSTFLSRQNGLQLVFINGCCSENQALELISAGVPAVIGTSQPIEDTVATDLSTRFYSGLAAGESIDRSWKAAADMAKSIKGESTYRSFNFDETPGTLSAFPWNMHYRDGADKVRDWNLPSASKSPLFGLPEIQDSYYRKLPATPFIGLNYFRKEYAGIFFGRGAQIRELYDRITGIHSIVLFYGNSGTGKSSLLDAGLIPRIEKDYDVQYVRRDSSKGLTVSLSDALRRANGTAGTDASLEMEEKDRQGKIKELKAAITTSSETVKKLLKEELKKLETSASNPTNLLDLWCVVEKTRKKPLIIVLDQVEECFTRPLSSGADTELVALLENVKVIFDKDEKMPQGKLILSYRKEFHPEIKDGFQKRMLPFSEVYLKHMDRDGIIEAIEGITRQSYTQEKYGLSLESSVAEIIADDLLEDKESPVAPMLQIVLTKLWNSAVKINPDKPVFTLGSYQEIKKAGVAMGEFFEQQMAQIRTWKPEVVDSGLILDVLYAHTTNQGTSGIQTLENLRENYQHIQDTIDNLVQKCKDLYLLTEYHGEKAATSLAHDTLAPVVIYRFNESDTPGQRANRILNNKLRDFDENKKGIYLDEADLIVVEQGLKGMKKLREKANNLLKISRELQVKRMKERRRNRLILRVLAGVIVVFGIFAAIQWNSAQKAKDETIHQIIRSSWKAGEFLKTVSEPNYEASGSWIQGVRSMYDYLRPIIDLEKMQSLSPVPIFISGPHTDEGRQEVNLVASDFGRYNPAFFKWGMEYLIPAAEDENFRALTQSVYNDLILDIARVYYDTYFFMQGLDPVAVDSVKNAYLAEIDKYKGQVYEGGFSTGPGEKIQFLFDYHFQQSTEGFLNPDMIVYNEIISPGFWIRRQIDGTDGEVFALLEKLLTTYDSEFVQATRQYYGR
ncbi:MAG: AAA family ATPase [Bacteroidia bacterium]|nr:AAA family ATPase [Bacteroidia bacterium]